MLRITIPGFATLTLGHLVCDYNGTLAHDGRLISGVAERLTALSRQLCVHIITADTFGSVAAETDALPRELAIIPKEAQDQAKQEYIAKLGTAGVVALGNGRNDRLMLADAALGIAVIQGEGAASAALTAADLCTPDILAALDLLANPERLIATLRN
ncbi:MAG: ATPase P [Desulfuromonas sp.]|nr:MAG: ATPase P [Desulfuromonas sp.]